MTSPTPAGPGDPPPPPAGPGVRPPFAAAPVEGRTARVWLGLGIAAAVVALCCGAGTVACGGLLVTQVQALNEQAHRTVGDYLEARMAGEWQTAYDQLCERDRREESLDEFTARVGQQPRIGSYELGDVSVSTAGELRLPADVDYANGTSERLTVPLVQDTETGRLRVCGLDE